MRTVVLFGDSITAGYGTEAITPILQEKIQQLLGEEAEKWELINAGMPGDTTADGLKRLEKDVLAKHPTIVTIFFGANDTNQARCITIEAFENNLISMLKRIGQEKIILITPPYVDCARKNTWLEEQICVYVTCVEKLGKQANIPVIPLYQIMTQEMSPTDLLQEDGLHFSSKGYDLLATCIVEELQKKE